MGRAVVVAVALVVFAACAGEPRDDSESSLVEDLQGASGDWLLTEGVVDGSDFDALEGTRVLLSIAGNELVSVSPCAAAFGPIVASPGGLEVETTNPFIGGGGCTAAVVEHWWPLHGALGRVVSAEVMGRSLALSGDGVELRYVPLEPLPEAVFGRDWTLVRWLPTLGNDLVLAAATATLRFDRDGTFEGTSGCGRWFGGTWELELDGFRFPRFDIEGPCPETSSAEIIDQHGHLTALGIGARPILADDQLYLVSGTGIADRISFIFE